jgi:hypothetical protein
METRRRVIRLLLSVAGCVLAGYVLLLLIVQIQARVDRHRAQLLLTEMRGLTVGKSNWQDLRGIRERWGKWGRDEGICTPKSCEYWIEVDDTAQRPRVYGVLLWVGRARFANAGLVIRMRDGILQTASYSLWVAVPKGDGPRWEAQRVKEDRMEPYSTQAVGYALIARATQTATLPELCCYEQGKRDHPQYVLSRPGGCGGCLAIWTDYTALASKRDQYRMTDFNFACMTRWRPCRDEEDIMPDVGREYEEQVAQERAELRRLGAPN